MSRENLELALKTVALFAFMFTVWSYYDQGKQREAVARLTMSAELAAEYRETYMRKFGRVRRALLPYTAQVDLDDESSVSDDEVIRIMHGALSRAPSEGSSPVLMDWLELLSFFDQVYFCSDSNLCSSDYIESALCLEVASFFMVSGRILTVYRSEFNDPTAGTGVEKLRVACIAR